MNRLGAVRRVGVAGLITAAAVLAACGSNDYPDSVRSNFLSACEARSGKKDVCACTLSKIEDKMSLEEFRSQDKAIRAGATPSKDITDANAACR
jgi:hypothetical protein